MAPVRPLPSRTSIANQSSVVTSAKRSRSLKEAYAVPHLQNKAHTKEHKRSLKHATLLSRLQRALPSSKVSKRRRPSKKLVTNLNALEDALPCTSTDGGRSQDRTRPSEKIKSESLKSRPGAMKKKQKLMAAEMERFAKNLALMTAEHNDDTEKTTSFKTTGLTKLGEISGAQTHSNSRARWAAIRDHIGRTMETLNDENSSS